MTSLVLNHQLDRRLERSRNFSIPWYLMASYLYYIRDMNILSDTRFDMLGKQIGLWWETICHKHKCIIRRDMLYTGCYILDEEYPQILVDLACHKAQIPEPPYIKRRCYDAPLQY